MKIGWRAMTVSMSEDPMQDLDHLLGLEQVELEDLSGSRQLNSTLLVGLRGVSPCAKASLGSSPEQGTNVLHS